MGRVMYISFAHFANPVDFQRLQPLSVIYLKILELSFVSNVCFCLYVCFVSVSLFYHHHHQLKRFDKLLQICGNRPALAEIACFQLAIDQ